MAKLFAKKRGRILITVIIPLLILGCTPQENVTEIVLPEITNTVAPTEKSSPTPPPSPTTAPPTLTPTSVPTETPTSISFEPFESEGLRIRLSIPADWSTKESREWGDLNANPDEKSLDLGISPYPDTLESNLFHQSSFPFSNEFKESAQVLFLGDLLNEGEGTMDEPIDILMFSLAWFLMGENLEGGEFIHEPESVEINGFDAALASVRAPGPPDQEDITWVWAVVKRNWSEVIWVIGMDGTDDARYHETILQTVKSIEFNASPGDFEISEMGIKVDLPDGWFYLYDSPESIEVFPGDPQKENIEISIMDYEILREDFPEDIIEEPMDLLAHIMEIIGVSSGEMELVQEPAEMEINGNAAALAEVQDDDFFGEEGGAIIVFAVIKNADGKILVFIGQDGTSDEMTYDLILGILNSIEFLPSSPDPF